MSFSCEVKLHATAVYIFCTICAFPFTSSSSVMPAGCFGHEALFREFLDGRKWSCHLGIAYSWVSGHGCKLVVWHG